MRIIGVDLDNTVIRYDALFHELALEAGLVGPDTPGRKKAIRDEIRAGRAGDVGWQTLQADAYGPRIIDAVLFDGVLDFLQAARQSKARVFVVSHKTEHARYGDPTVSLREKALDFLNARGVLEHLAAGASDVHFSATRAEKCRLVQDLDCAVFVDDLLETFDEPAFPTGVERILFDPAGQHPDRPRITRLESWAAVRCHVLG